MGKIISFGKAGRFPTRGPAASHGSEGATRKSRRKKHPGTPRNLRALFAGAFVLAAGFTYQHRDLPLIRGMLVMTVGAPGLRLDKAGAPPDRSAVTAAIDRHFSMCGSMPRSNCVVDGDTFYYGHEKVRIADIDTPEIFSPHCNSERRLGEVASRRLNVLLNEGPIDLESVDRDRDSYGRLLRVVSRDGRSLGAMLVAEGLAHRWIGRKLSWCG